MNINHPRINAIITSALIILPASLLSHDMWIDAASFILAPGSSPVISYPSDHAFPTRAGEYVPAAQLSKSYIAVPKGNVIGLTPAGKDRYRPTRALTIPGTYLVVSGKNWTSWTKTTEGYVEGKNKTQVKNPIRGIRSGKFSKAVLTVGEAAGNAYSTIAGHALEIVPLKDPGTLRRGDRLPIRILFNGKPASIEVRATYEGYSTKDNVFALSIKTDENGICTIPLKRTGKWLIVGTMRVEEKNRRLHDEILYASTLTFQIR